MKSLRILLEKDTYNPGDVINGVVGFFLEKHEQQIKRLRLDILGQAEVKSSISENGTSGQLQTISSKEIYFQDGTVLVESNGEYTSLKPGPHSFPFKFKLPLEIPSSYEGNYGTVRYTFKCTLVRPWKTSAKYEKAITMTNPLLLGDNPFAPLPWRQQAVEKNGGIGCVRGDVHALLQLDHRGLLPGEKLYFTAFISNNSARKLSKVKFSFNMIVWYKANDGITKPQQQITKLKKLEKGSLGPGESEEWRDLSILLPQHLPASNLEHCYIMDIGYYLEMAIFSAGLTKDIRIPKKIPSSPRECNVVVGSAY